MSKKSTTGSALSKKNQTSNCQGRRINGCLVNGKIYARKKDFVRDTCSQLLDRLYNPNYQPDRQDIESILMRRHNAGNYLYTVYEIEKYMNKKTTSLLNKLAGLKGKPFKTFMKIATLNENFLKNLKKSVCQPQVANVNVEKPKNTTIVVAKAGSTINIYNDVVYNYCYVETKK